MLPIQERWISIVQEACILSYRQGVLFVWLRWFVRYSTTCHRMLHSWMETSEASKVIETEKTLWHTEIMWLGSANWCQAQSNRERGGVLLSCLHWALPAEPTWTTSGTVASPNASGQSGSRCGLMWPRILYRLTNPRYLLLCKIVNNVHFCPAMLYNRLPILCVWYLQFVCVYFWIKKQ